MPDDEKTGKEYIAEIGKIKNGALKKWRKNRILLYLNLKLNGGWKRSFNQ